MLRLGFVYPKTALDESLADGCIYADPNGEWEGRAAIVRKIEQFRSETPNTVFRNHAYLAHHTWSLAHWTLYDAGGEAMVLGASVAEYGPDGRIVRVTGFFRLPQFRARHQDTNNGIGSLSRFYVRFEEMEARMS